MTDAVFTLKDLLHPLFGSHMVLQHGVRVPIWGWADPGENIRVSFAGQSHTVLTGRNGHWMILLDKLTPGGPFIMHVALDDELKVTLHDVYVGEVWLCSGQSNMDQRVATGRLHWCGVENETQEIAAASHPLIRLYSVRLQMSDEPCAKPANGKTQYRDRNAPPYLGKWVVCSPKTVGNFSAVAYFYARELQKINRLPIGLITCCYGASAIQSWIGREALDNAPHLAHLHPRYQLLCQKYETGESFVEYRKILRQWHQLQKEYEKTGNFPPAYLNRKPRRPKKPKNDQHSPSVLYNGMIAPLIPYALKGVIWYHGESMVGTTDEYASMLKLLIREWRKAWGVEFAFFVVQFANVNRPNETPIEFKRIPLIREAQLQSLTVEKTALIVTIDLGAENIHPRNKQKVGERIALAAYGLVYEGPVTYSGPLYDKMSIEGEQIRIYFKHAEGLYFIGEPKAFVIAGSDGNFSWAKLLVVEEETVLVSSPDVPRPVMVRFGWAEYPTGILYNKHGLPASPFRTDLPCVATET